MGTEIAKKGIKDYSYDEAMELAGKDTFSNYLYATGTGRKQWLNGRRLIPSSRRTKADDDKNDNDDFNTHYSGNGRYNVFLLLTLSLTLLAMCVDLFSFSVIVTLSSCDFNLDLTQKSILVSMPFVGPILTAYFWGYFSDTRGRKKSLIIGMSVSFVLSSLCAFSPNWITMAILKLIGTCFCSCAQSSTFTLLGESCAERVKGSYMLIMSSIMHFGSSIYFTLAYLVGYVEFSYDLGFITFLPWRLLVLIYALPLGLCAISLTFFYESPKFLLNAGYEDKALDAFRGISRRNGRDMDKYQVHKLVLNEDGNLERKDVSLLESMWEQTVPIFKPPLLLKTLLLYYLIFIVYGTNGGLYIWLPFLADVLADSNFGSGGNQSWGLCSLISEKSKLTQKSDSCTSIDVSMVIATVSMGVVFAFLNIVMSKLASRKRALMVGILTSTGTLCLLTNAVPSKISSIFFYGVMATGLCMGPLFSYFVDVYPTSFRGMASCLGVMAARISSVIGINLVGPFITDYCNNMFYSIAAILFSGVLMSFFLPPDRKKVIN